MSLDWNNQNRSNRKIKDFYQHKSEYKKGMFKFGKYAGLYIKDILKSDRQYVEWCVANGVIGKKHLEE